MEIKNITFSYSGEKEQLTSISGSINRGEITTIIGPNGCGKSTLLNILSHNLKAQKGEIILDGKAIHQYQAKELAKKVAIVHQHNEAPGDMTVEKLVSYGRIPHQSFFSGQSEEDKEAIEWALSSTNLLQKRSVRIDSLSGGERQRVWIAMSLAQKTKILFLDEPTTYLDMYYQFEILELVKKLKEQYGLTIVMVLHDINQAITYSQHLIVMKDGEMKLMGKPTEVISEKTMKDIYNIDIKVKEDTDTGMYILPVGI